MADFFTKEKTEVAQTLPDIISIKLTKIKNRPHTVLSGFNPSYDATVSDEKSLLKKLKTEICTTGGHLRQSGEDVAEDGTVDGAEIVEDDQSKARSKNRRKDQSKDKSKDQSKDQSRDHQSKDQSKDQSKVQYEYVLQGNKKSELDSYLRKLGIPSNLIRHSGTL